VLGTWDRGLAEMVFEDLGLRVLVGDVDS
jgi:hypothetical protein